MSFSDLGLQPELLRAVAEKGYGSPTPVQSEAIPAILAGRDVLAGAQTGTGKTAAFVLPILQRLAQADSGASRRLPRALVLTPTRELAAQVADNARIYGRHLDIRTAVVFGGVGINPQIEALRRGCDLLVATPGRLLDLADQGALELRDVGQFVLDEADRMLDMGFIHSIRQVLKLLPPGRQNLMFSATYSEDIRGLAQRFLRDPVTVQAASRNATAERIEQCLYRVPKEHKRHLLAHLILEGNWQQALVFTRTKHGANRLATQLEHAGIAAAAIHGNKSQSARTRALDDFKNYRITALVATEVAARGLDIKELPHVVNFELPNVPEDYVHRIGRTARAGATGSAVSLVSPDETPLLRDIEKLLKRAIPQVALPQFPLVANETDGTDAGGRGEGREPAVGAGRPLPRQGNPRRGEGQRPRYGSAGRSAAQAGPRAQRSDPPSAGRGTRAGSPAAAGGGHAGAPAHRGRHPHGNAQHAGHGGSRDAGRDAGRAQAEGWRRA